MNPKELVLSLANLPQFRKLVLSYQAPRHTLRFGIVPSFSLRASRPYLKKEAFGLGDPFVWLQLKSAWFCDLVYFGKLPIKGSFLLHFCPLVLRASLRLWLKFGASFRGIRTLCLQLFWYFWFSWQQLWGKLEFLFSFWRGCSFKFIWQGNLDSCPLAIWGCLVGTFWFLSSSLNFCLWGEAFWVRLDSFSFCLPNRKVPVYKRKMGFEIPIDLLVLQPYTCRYSRFTFFNSSKLWLSWAVSPVMPNVKSYLMCVCAHVHVDTFLLNCNC